jgi:acyl-CoA thioester hydrolase
VDGIGSCGLILRLNYRGSVRFDVCDDNTACSFVDSEVVLQLLVRPNDIDRLGHVNNAVLLEYCEAGRHAWLRQNGIEVGPVLPVVARAEVDFLREIGEGEVQVATRLAEYGAYSATFRHSIQADGRDAGRAKIQVGFIHSQSRAIASVDEFFGAHLSRCTLVL